LYLCSTLLLVTRVEELIKWLGILSDSEVLLFFW
jgi:hypothetical protein